MLYARHTRNNPLRYTDPTGYYTDDEITKIFGVNNYDAVIKQFEKGGKFDGKWGFLNLLHAAKNGDNVYFLGNTPSMGDGTIEFFGSYNFNFDGKGLLAPSQVSREGNACYLLPGELAGQVNSSDNGFIYEAFSSQGDVLGQFYIAAGQKANRPDAKGMLINSVALVIDTLSVIYGKGSPGAPGTAVRTMWLGVKTANGLYGGYQALDSSALVVNKVVNGESPNVFELGNAGFDVASVADARLGVLNDLRGVYGAWINGVP